MIRHCSWVSLAALLALSGCATRIVVRPVELPLPPKLTSLPTVSGDELQCLAPDVYKRLGQRQSDIVTRVKKLRAIIDANNEAAKDNQ